MIYVFAGNYQQYANFVGIPTKLTEQHIRYVRGLESIRGISDFNVVRVGTYTERKDYHDIMDSIVARNGQIVSPEEAVPIIIRAMHDVYYERDAKQVAKIKKYEQVILDANELIQAEDERLRIYKKYQNVIYLIIASISVVVGSIVF